MHFYLESFSHACRSLNIFSYLLAFACFRFTSLDILLLLLYFCTRSWLSNDRIKYAFIVLFCTLDVLFMIPAYRLDTQQLYVRQYETYTRHKLWKINDINARNRCRIKSFFCFFFSEKKELFFPALAIHIYCLWKWKAGLFLSFGSINRWMASTFWGLTLKYCSRSVAASWNT